MDEKINRKIKIDKKTITTTKLFSPFNLGQTRVEIHKITKPNLFLLVLGKCPCVATGANFNLIGNCTCVATGA